MLSYNNERQVQQGEDWNLDILLSASDKEYIPYLVSSQRANPFFVVTVASTKFEKNLRYVESWWNDIKNGEYKIPLFYQTVPQYYGEFTTTSREEAVTSGIARIYNLGEINEILTASIVFTYTAKTEYRYINDGKTCVSVDGGKINFDYVSHTNSTITQSEYSYDRRIYKYTLPDDITEHYFTYDYIHMEPIFTDNFAEAVKFKLPTLPVGNATDDHPDRRLLYYYTIETEEIDPTTGHKPYHYFYFEYEPDPEVASKFNVKRIDDYECHVRFNFNSEITAKWGGQNYMYQITLVSGISMEEKLQQIFDVKEALGEITQDQWPTTIEEKYKLVKLMWPKELQPDIDATSPLGKIEHPEPILPPTKLEVFNNLRTLI